LFVAARYGTTDVKHMPSPRFQGFIHKGLHVEGPGTIAGGESDLLSHQPRATARSKKKREESREGKPGSRRPQRSNDGWRCWGDYDNEVARAYVANASSRNILPQ